MRINKMKQVISQVSRYGAVAALVLGAGINTAAAVVVQVGDDVTFTYDETSLFGLGTVVGNSIFFSPTTFIAQSDNTDGAVVATDTLNIDITVNAGSSYTIGEFALVERGDYRLNGSSTSVSAEGRLQVTSNTTLCSTFMVCQGIDNFSAGPLTTQGVLTEWTANGEVDLSDVAGWGSDTSVQAQIQNVLTATSNQIVDQALVQKKFEGVGIAVLPEVPVPAAAWLFGSALLGLAGVRRSK